MACGAKAPFQSWFPAPVRLLAQVVRVPSGP